MEGIYEVRGYDKEQSRHDGEIPCTLFFSACEANDTYYEYLFSCY